MRSFFFFLALITAMSFSGMPEIRGQEETPRIIAYDTIPVDSLMQVKSPRKAAMFSMVLPGMGQIYNEKYWKVPIVYAGLGGLGYGAVWNTRQYEKYRDLYKYMSDNGLSETEEGQSLEEVEFYKDSHLRYKNLLTILTVGFYALQIIDASVDAHLFDYDIGDDITLRIDPVMMDACPAGSSMHANTFVDMHENTGLGLRCCLSF